MLSTARFFPRDGRFWLLHSLCWWAVVIALSNPVQLDDYAGVLQLYSSDLRRFFISIPVLLLFRYGFLQQGWQELKLAELICLTLGFNFVSAIFVSLLVPNAVGPANLWFDVLQRESASTPRALDEAMVSFFYSFILQSCWCLFYILAQRDKLHTYFQAHSASLKRELKTTKSLVLHQQISPHFLFNGLNNVCSLIDEDAEKAQAVLRNLAQLLRFNMNVGQRQSLSLREEVRFLSLYLSICELQYEDRLRFSQTVDEGALDFQLPCLAIQTLVENAIKHGVARSKNVTSVRLSISLMQSFVEVRVANDSAAEGDCLKKDPDDALCVEKNVEQGLGLRNLRERLNLFFGESARLSLSCGEKEIVATMRFPKKIIASS